MPIQDSNSTDNKDNTVITIETGEAGQTYRATVDSENRLLVNTKINSSDNSDFFLDVAKGDVTNHCYVNKFGSVPNLSSGDIADVYDYGNTVEIYPFPTSALTTTVVSTSANDTSSGTGARTVEIQGLASDYSRLTSTATLNGLTPVTLPTNFLRVFRIKVLTAGSTGWNEGNIEVKHSTTVLGYITIGRNQTLMAIYTIPLNCTGYFYQWHTEISADIGSTNTKQAEIRLLARPFGGVFNTKDLRVLQSNASQLQNYNKIPIVFEEKTDIKIQAYSGTNNTYVTSGFEILLIGTGV